MDWYYTQGTERVGPVSEAEFQQLIESGVIRDDTFVWNPTLADWLPYAERRLDPPPVSEQPPQPPPMPVPIDAAETSAPAPAPARKRMQQTFLCLLLLMLGFGIFVEIWFRLSVDPGTMFSDYALLQRGVYWITMLFGVLALWEQGRRPAFSLRLCVAVPFVLGLINPTLYRVLIASVSAQDAGAIGAYQLIFLLGNATRLIDITCAVYGLVLLRGLRKPSIPLSHSEQTRTSAKSQTRFQIAFVLVLFALSACSPTPEYLRNSKEFARILLGAITLLAGIGIWLGYMSNLKTGNRASNRRSMYLFIPFLVLVVITLGQVLTYFLAYNDGSGFISVPILIFFLLLRCNPYIFFLCGLFGAMHFLPDPTEPNNSK